MKSDFQTHSFHSSVYQLGIIQQHVEKSHISLITLIKDYSVDYFFNQSNSEANMQLAP